MMAIDDTHCSDEPGDEAALVRAVLDGDTSAYAVLYDRYAQLIRAVCYDTTRNVADAQDLAQEVFLRAFRKLADLRHPERFAAWLVAIARMTCRQWRRGKARQGRHIAELQTSSAAEIDPPSDGANVRTLHEVLLRLPEKERVAIQVFYLLGESADQARATLGLSRSGLYRVLERARKRLKRLMEGHCHEKR